MGYFLAKSSMEVRCDSICLYSHTSRVVDSPLWSSFPPCVHPQQFVRQVSSLYGVPTRPQEARGSCRYSDPRRKCNGIVHSDSILLRRCMAIPGASMGLESPKTIEGCWPGAAESLIGVFIVWNVAQSNHQMFALTVLRSSRPVMAPFNARDSFLWPTPTHDRASATQCAFPFGLAYYLTLVGVILENLLPASPANNTLSSNDVHSPIRRDTAI